MSLDIWFELPGASKPKGSGIFIREDGGVREISRDEWDASNPGREPVAVIHEESTTDEVYCGNVTHNLGRMADEAGIYNCLWKPNEHGIMKSGQMVAPLEVGIAKLEADPKHFKTFNPKNGWGDYDGLLDFARRTLAAAKEYPTADVRTWR